MTTYDPRAHLAALLGHLNAHPHLNDVYSTQTNEDGIRVHACSSGPAWSSPQLPALAAWARTLSDATTVLVAAVSDEPDYTHLHLDGHIADSIPAKVVVVLERDESDLLAANTVVEVDARIPVELLLRLTNHHTAEQAERDTARVCPRCDHDVEALAAGQVCDECSTAAAQNPAPIERHNPIRYFHDQYGARWRVHPDGLIQTHDGDAWTWSAYTLDDLLAEPDITENPDTSELPDEPPPAIAEQTRKLATDGLKILAIKLVREPSSSSASTPASDCARPATTSRAW